jgi:hypothetical protein
MKRAAMLLACVGLLASEEARADCGSIPFKPYVSVFEPNQRDLLAWDGHEEILFVSTDLRASEPTKVLEVIPFPSEPKVAKADQEILVRATGLINRKLSPAKTPNGPRRGLPGTTASEAPAPAGEVTFHQQIGAHDISVMRAVDRAGFVLWVGDYLRKSGVENPNIPDVMRTTVEEYLRDNYRWFAFNVVELGADVGSKEAIQYRFKTSHLYYPLRISRTGEGDTTVRLLVLSPKMVEVPDLGGAELRLVHKPLQVTADELRTLDKDFRKFFRLSTGQTVLLRTWEFRGPLTSFAKDVITK